MKRYIWTSDLHIGLMTDEIDRTDEIISITMNTVKYAVKVKADGFIFGGDIFDKNNPSSYLKTKFLKVLNVLFKAGIKTWIMDGNHDKISDPNKMSCLQFFGEIRKAYTNVRWISDIKFVRAFKSEVADCYFTFLPHISLAQIDRKKYKSTQEYIEHKCKAIKKKVPREAQHYVFSHLNVRGAVPGTEQFMLKRSEVWLPSAFTIMDGLNRLPEITQGHIHIKNKLNNNINIVGSPIFTHFGEKQKDKFFLEMKIPEWIEDGPVQFIYHKTKCRKLIDIDFDVSVGNIDSLKKHISSQNIDKNSILKINITSPEVNRVFDWEAFRQSLMKHVYYVKPIKPRFIRQRIKRNMKQVLGIPPSKSVQLWMESHFKKKEEKKRKQKLLDLAAGYIEGQHL